MPIPNSTTISSELIEASAFSPTPFTHSAISPFATTATSPTSTTGSTATSGLRKIASSRRTMSTIVPTATIVFALPADVCWS